MILTFVGCPLGAKGDVGGGCLDGVGVLFGAADGSGLRISGRGFRGFPLLPPGCDDWCWDEGPETAVALEEDGAVGDEVIGANSEILVAGVAGPAEELPTPDLSSGLRCLVAARIDPAWGMSFFRLRNLSQPPNLTVTGKLGFDRLSSFSSSPLEIFEVLSLTILVGRGPSPSVLALLGGFGCFAGVCTLLPLVLDGAAFGSGCWSSMVGRIGGWTAMLSL